MTLVESLAPALLHGFGKFIPISAEAHQLLLEKWTSFPAPDQGWCATYSLGALLALMVFYFHDWASILSSWIQVLVYRKKPMTLDERFPFFLIAAMLIPGGVAWYISSAMGRTSIFEVRQEFPSIGIAAALMVGSVFLGMASRWSRFNRGPFDLGLTDSLLFGFGQLIAWIPGVGGTLGILAMAQFRNYHLETTTKFAALMSLPFLAYDVFEARHMIAWFEAEPLPSTPWYHWTLALVVAFGAATLGLRILNDQIRRNGFSRLNGYRFVIALVLGGLLIFK